MTQELETTIPQTQSIISVPRMHTNYIDKIRFVSKFGNFCQKCRNFARVDDLTVDHISPRFLCHKEQYNSDSNKQLLCRLCHEQKSRYEGTFMSRMTRRIIEEIHYKNTTIVDLTDIIQEYRDSIEEAQKSGWRIRIERSDLPKVEKPSPPPTMTTSKPTTEEQIIQLMNTLIKKMVPLIEDRGQLDIS